MTERTAHLNKSSSDVLPCAQHEMLLRPHPLNADFGDHAGHTSMGYGAANQQLDNTQFATPNKEPQP